MNLNISKLSATFASRNFTGTYFNFQFKFKHKEKKKNITFSTYEFVFR